MAAPQTPELLRIRDITARHAALCKAAMSEIPTSDPAYEEAARRAEAAVEALEHFGRMLRCFCSMLGIHGPGDVPGYVAAPPPDEGPRPTTAADNAAPLNAEGEGPTEGGSR